MRAVIFMFALAAAQTNEKTTWEMLEDMKASQYTAQTNFEMHRAETENLADWRDMRTKCSGALDHYMSQQYPNIQTLLNDMVNDDTTWFTHAMAFDAIKQHQLDMGMSNALPYAPYADNGGTNDHEEMPATGIVSPAPVTATEPVELKEEPCHCEAETIESCESEKCAEWCFLMDDKEDLCYKDDSNHVDYGSFYHEAECVSHGGTFIPNDPECRGLMVWTANPEMCYDQETGAGLSETECAQHTEDCHMMQAGVCGPIENVHTEWTPCIDMDFDQQGCYQLNSEPGSADRCYWMPECANGSVVGAEGEEGCDPIYCEDGSCPDWCDPMRVQHTQTGEWHACHELTEQSECDHHNNACAWQVHGICEPPNSEDDPCTHLNPDECIAKQGQCVQETHDFGQKCIHKV